MSAACSTARLPAASSVALQAANTSDPLAIAAFCQAGLALLQAFGRTLTVCYSIWQLACKSYGQDIQEGAAKSAVFQP